MIFGRSHNIVNIDLAYLTNSQGFSIIGAAHSVSGAGDVNGDGFDDIIIGSPNQNSNAGITYVIFGAQSNIEANSAPKTATPSIEPTVTPTMAEESSGVVSSSPTASIFLPIPSYVTVHIKFGGFYKYTDDILGNGNFIIDSPTNVVVTAGSGADIFTIMPHTGVITTITNFDLSDEIIDLSNFATIHNIDDFAITDKNAVVIKLPNDEEVRLLNLVSEDIVAGNFIFTAATQIEDNHDNPSSLSYGAIVGILTGGVLCLASVGYLLYAKSFNHWPFILEDYSTLELAGHAVETSSY